MPLNVRLLLVSAAALLACDGQLSAGSADAPIPSSVFSERQPLVVTRPSARVGEDCSVGPGLCTSGLCLHASEERDTGYFCSKRCRNDAHCPVEWSCVQTYPTDDGWACVPPVNWKAGPASSRPSPGGSAEAPLP